MRKRLKNILIVTFILFIGSSMLFAQSRTGTLKVTVTDDEGNIVPGATLTLSSPVMMGEKSMITDTSGEALFINLTPGIYELKSSIEGFQEKIIEKIEVSLDKQTFLQVELNLATIEESVTVVAVSPAVDTTKSVIAEHITHDTVESLPKGLDSLHYIEFLNTRERNDGFGFSVRNESFYISRSEFDIKGDENGTHFVGRYHS